MEIVLNDLATGAAIEVTRENFLKSGILKLMGYQPDLHPEHKIVFDLSQWSETFTLAKVPIFDSSYNTFHVLGKNPMGGAFSVYYTKEVTMEATPIAGPVGIFTGVRSGRSLSGWDPEFFVTHGDGSLFPAFEFLPSKKQAVAGGHDHEFSPAYWDGFQAEFRTHQVSCHQYGFNRLRNGLMHVIQAARKRDKDASLTLQNVFHIPTPMLTSASEEHVALGCKPSLNAYDTPAFSADNPLAVPVRVAGGHIHFELPLGSRSDAHVRRVAKMMDFFLTIPTVGMYAEIDDPSRRKFYGRAGEYRKPFYGIEYRTLSNAWLGCPQPAHLVMEIARLAAGLATTQFDLSDISLGDSDIQGIIDTCDVNAARSLFDKHFPLWRVALDRFGNLDAFQKMVMEGVESVYPNFRNVEANWRLNKSSYWESNYHQWDHFNPSYYR